MTDDELELAILEKFAALHQAAHTAGHPTSDKCTRELDMRYVVGEITGEEGANLEYMAELWIDRLAPPLLGAGRGTLRRCSSSLLTNSR